MSVFRGSVGYLRYRVQQASDKQPQWTRMINARRFMPLSVGSDAEMSGGWVKAMTPFDTDGDFGPEDYTYGDRILLAYRLDKWAIPKPQLERETKVRLAKIAREENKDQSEFGKAFIKATRRAVMLEMRARSIPKATIIEVVWTPSRGEVRIWSRSTVAKEQITGLFERTFSVRLDMQHPALRARDMISAMDEGVDRDAFIRAFTRITPNLSFKDIT